MATRDWFLNGQPVMRTNNHIATKDNDLTVTEALPSYYSKRRHVLIIRSVRDADFGRYECKAENTQGLASGNITLSGNPLKPTFESRSQPATATTKVLSWQTQSLSPVIDYKFRFRQVPTGNESFRKGMFLWNQLTIPADRDTTGPFHTKSYKLEGLNPSSVYEVVIEARNQYGHSELSNALRFSTPGLTDIISSSSTESNEYDSRFELELENEIYPSPYNAGSRTQCSLTMAAAASFTSFLPFGVLLQFFICK